MGCASSGPVQADASAKYGVSGAPAPPRPPGFQEGNADGAAPDKPYADISNTVVAEAEEESSMEAAKPVQPAVPAADPMRDRLRAYALNLKASGGSSRPQQNKSVFIAPTALPDIRSVVDHSSDEDLGMVASLAHPSGMPALAQTAQAASAASGRPTSAGQATAATLANNNVTHSQA